MVIADLHNLSDANFLCGDWVTLVTLCLRGLLKKAAFMNTWTGRDARYLLLFR